MPKYALFFSYTAEAWGNMIKNPGDRAAVARAVAESAGGTLESIYFMFGDHDGMAICDMPDGEAAAATSIAVTSSGAFRSVETRELIEPERLVAVLGKARVATGVYRAPGS